MTLTSLDTARPFSEAGVAILANPQGCAVRFGRPLEVGVSVQLEGLLAEGRVIARVVNCISLGEYEKFWLIGLALDVPGNVWGIETPPEDWSATISTRAGTFVRRSTVFPVCTLATILERLRKKWFSVVASLPTMRTAPKPLILCVEDGATYLTLRKKVLEREGYEIIGVTTADEALKALHENPICATISDHMLQGTTGAELARRMKKIKPNVPIIVFSGTVPQSLQGVDVYVNKGEPTATFLGIVREVVQRSCS
jgi:CheY-like chemotaxis protein